MSLSRMMLSSEEVFPDLVWDKICEKLGDPQDKLMLLMVDRQLEEQFESKSDEWRFRAVLPILLKNLRFSRDDDFTNDTDTSPLALKRFLLNCRLLSSIYRKIVDKQIESVWKETCCPPSFLPSSFETWSFSTIDRLRRFLQEMGNHPEERTPLLRRIVSLILPPLTNNDENGDEDRELAELIIQFLQKTGRHLKGLCLYLTVHNGNPPPGDEFRDLIQRIVALVPNLEWLNLCLDVAEVLPFLQPDAPAAAVVAPRPAPPKLPNLEILYIDQSTILHYLNYEEYFPQLTILRMDLSLWRDELSTKKGLFPNLQTLILSSSVITETWSEDEEGKVLKLLKYVDAPHFDELEFEKPVDYDSGRMNAMLTLKDEGISCLKKRFADWDWKCEFGTGYNSLRIYSEPKSMKLSPSTCIVS